MLVDSHCHLDHLDLEPYDGSLETLLNSCRSSGVTRLLSVATSLASAERLQKMVAHLPEVYIAVGVHPLQEQAQPVPEAAELRAAASAPNVIAIGETGLDRHYSADTLDWQRESFRCHAKVSTELGKPLIVHTREAPDETLAILRDCTTPEIAGVLHCFTESWDMARLALELNFYISISGIVTFRNAEDLRNTVKKIPLNRLLIETDSPWLAPVPHRGKQNVPAYVLKVAQCIAQLKNITLAELAEITSNNFDRLFRLE